jgi:hypothetical protein
MARTPASATLLQVGEAPAVAMAMTYLALADSISLVMSNAAATQQRGQVVSEAALAQVLVAILAKGVSS